MIISFSCLSHLSQTRYGVVFSLQMGSIVTARGYESNSKDNNHNNSNINIDESDVIATTTNTFSLPTHNLSIANTSMSSSGNSSKQQLLTSNGILDYLVYCVVLGHHITACLWLKDNANDWVALRLLQLLFLLLLLLLHRRR
ncbi:unnamed protein product [Ceratitis capitata]|uniref:(Mediterranean fruit fly) hypothetical protein n=1 Tax=Ceratitis capitata TaxID=7213 RepID=A0A811UXQ6_CERCA|nr:unnamed protein product [Ceratitis capitata]